MTEPVRAVAPGKVNLHFQVGPRRPDGYHGVASLYAAVEVLETVDAALDPALGPGRVRCELQVVAGSLVDQQQARGAFGPAQVPLGETNLAARAALAVLGQAPPLSSGLLLGLGKAVPVAGGMGGGSADAAAALRATAALVERETGHHVPEADLLEIAATLGADVPFALLGGAAVGTGTGTQLTPVPVGAPWPAVLIADEAALSTPTVFARLDRLRETGRLPQRREDELVVPPQLLAALAAGDGAAGAALVGNDLHAAAVDLEPRLARRIEQVEALGARALVSGSGPTLIALPRADGTGADSTGADSAGRRADGSVWAVRTAQALRAAGACALATSIG